MWRHTNTHPPSTITGINVYIIHSTPSDALLTKYVRAGAEIITIDPGIDVVIARAKQERPWWMQGAIKRWYDLKGEHMTANPNRGGHRWTQVKTDFKTKCEQRQLPCHLCEQPIDYTAPPQQADAFEADHDKPVATHPDLAYQSGNLLPSHSSCNRSRGSNPIVRGEWIAADW